MIRATAHLMWLNEVLWAERIIKAVLEAPFEVVLLYDCGSEDGTLDVARSFDDPRLRIEALGKLTPEANGQVRQLMIDATETPWAYNVDGDELYPPGMLERILSVPLPDRARTGFILLHEVDETPEGLRIVSQTSGHRLHHESSTWTASYPFETTQYFGVKEARFYYPNTVYGYHLHALKRSPLDAKTYFREQKRQLGRKYLDLEIPDGGLFPTT